MKECKPASRVSVELLFVLFLSFSGNSQDPQLEDVDYGKFHAFVLLAVLFTYANVTKKN